ncbi:MAG TPA: dihydrodipicolinate synthase family protein [Planctomycetota bacterium]|jgi:N-acetylneuraminate lyase
MSNMQSLTGLIAATCAPLKDDGALAVDRTGKIVEQLLREGVSGLYVNGTTGEGLSLTGAERRAIAEAYVSAAAGRVPVLVQVGHNSLRESRELAAHAQKIGAAGVSMMAPSYIKPDSARTMVDCLAEVAVGAPELPIYYYHIPHLTGVTLDVPEILRLAAEKILSFAGMKFTSPALHEFQSCLEFGRARLSSRQKNGANTSVPHGANTNVPPLNCLWGVDEMLLSAWNIGARGAVGSTYNFAAPLYRRMLDALARGDMDEARKRQAQAVLMLRVLNRYRGLAAFKVVMQFIGLDCGPARLPLRTLDKSERDALRRELQEIGFFEWARP